MSSENPLIQEMRDALSSVEGYRSEAHPNAECFVPCSQASVRAVLAELELLRATPGGATEIHVLANGSHVTGERAALLLDDEMRGHEATRKELRDERLHVETEYVAAWKKIQAVLPEPAFDDKRSLCQRVLDAISAAPQSSTAKGDVDIVALAKELRAMTLGFVTHEMVMTAWEHSQKVVRTPTPATPPSAQRKPESMSDAEWNEAIATAAEDAAAPSPGSEGEPRVQRIEATMPVFPCEMSMTESGPWYYIRTAEDWADDAIFIFWRSITSPKEIGAILLALRPFTGVGRPKGVERDDCRYQIAFYDCPEDLVIYNDQMGHVITVGDFRRADAALQQSKGDKG